MNVLASRMKPLERSTRAAALPGDATILRHLGGRDPWHRVRKPQYQLQMIKDLAALLPGGPCRVLDIGAGSGLIGEAIAALFPGKTVTGLDVALRPLPNLRIPLMKFDGRRLPFADASFDCALLCNVLHHVKPEARSELLREALRVTDGGPIVVKDHLAGGPLDGARLWLLDLLGNALQGGMVSASYLAPGDWEALLRELGCEAELLPVSAYRKSPSAWCFPNSLEVCLRISATDRPRTGGIIAAATLAR